ncbi:unnamed protein product [Cylicocyclus nassatus]|uniref:Uncharacterized protein n=1 Tax=Cylicocyclus nassatus TaxID=53992 RepID=A0AA36GRX5_CYLNA|nr:unnamed protein product [Cylicocyclus nassatus]
MEFGNLLHTIRKTAMFRMIILFMSLLVPVTTMSVRCVRSVEQSFTAVYNKGDKFATSHFMALKEIESASKNSNSANMESFDLTSKHDDYTLTLKKYYIKYPYQIHNVFKELTITHKGKKIRQCSAGTKRL